MIQLVKDCNGSAKYIILGRRQHFKYLDISGNVLIVSIDFAVIFHVSIIVYC